MRDPWPHRSGKPRSRWPASCTESTAEVNPVTKRGESDGGSVLVVDDDELVRWSAAEGLREQGYSVAVAASAREALRGCRDAAVALLADDLAGADGLAIAERLRRRHPRCAVVLMTADPTPERRRQARERGVARLLGKPFSLEGLVGAIEDALEDDADRSGTTEAPRGH